MTRIIDARTVGLKGRRVLFDANIWMFINGFGANASGERASLYSAAYKRLLQNDNTIVLNNYILGEFFNRCTKLEYELKRLEFVERGLGMPPFKAYRRSPEFRLVLESIRDTCLNMIDDCEYVSVDGCHYDITSVLHECCDERADFTDRILICFCKQEKLPIMTDDADFSSSGLDVITGNRRMRLT